MKQGSFLNIDRIAFLGRTYSEYLKIFGLDEDILSQGPVLDCPAGSSSFSAEARLMGYDVTACDILYGRRPQDLIKKGYDDLRHVFDKFDEVSHQYTWKFYRDKNNVIELRRKALELFALDFKDSYGKGRYVHSELPNLPFADRSFSLVLSGHFLFLYGDRLDPNFHMACLEELIRVSSSEVRIFPLVGLDAEPYPYMDDVLSHLNSIKVEVEVMDVDFEFLKGANQILRLRRK